MSKRVGNAYTKQTNKPPAYLSYNSTMIAPRKREYDFLIKAILVGNSAVGKTCINLRYTDDKFSPSFITTIGIDFKIKNVNVDGKNIRLQIWDTAGQERFVAITKQYLRGGHVILLVYDITDRESFENVENWINTIYDKADSDVCILLVGNKIDMEKKRVVMYEEGEKLAKKFKVPFFECSAKTGENINKIFDVAIEKYMSSGKMKQQELSKIKLPENPEKKSNCCN